MTKQYASWVHEALEVEKDYKGRIVQQDSKGRKFVTLGNGARKYMYTNRPNKAVNKALGSRFKTFTSRAKYGRVCEQPLFQKSRDSNHLTRDY